MPKATMAFEWQAVCGFDDFHRLRPRRIGARHRTPIGVEVRDFRMVRWRGEEPRSLLQGAVFLRSMTPTDKVISA